MYSEEFYQSVKVRKELQNVQKQVKIEPSEVKKLQEKMLGIRGGNEDLEAVMKRPGINPEDLEEDTEESEDEDDEDGVIPYDKLPENMGKDLVKKRPASQKDLISKELKILIGNITKAGHNVLEAEGIYRNKGPLHAASARRCGQLKDTCLGFALQNKGLLENPTGAVKDRLQKKGKELIEEVAGLVKLAKHL